MGFFALFYVIVFFWSVYYSLKFQWSSEGKDERGQTILNRSYSIAFPAYAAWLVSHRID